MTEIHQHDRLAACPAGEECTEGVRTLFKPLRSGALPMHRSRSGEPCKGARQMPTAPPVYAPAP
jgi:hypothetical protein